MLCCLDDDDDGGGRREEARMAVCLCVYTYLEVEMSASGG
jgi:hypothetical protein